MPRFVGLDIHKRVVEACVLDAAGQVVQRLHAGTSRVALEALARTVLRPDDHVALEATTDTWAIVRVLPRSSPRWSSPIRSGRGRSPTRR